MTVLALALLPVYGEKAELEYCDCFCLLFRVRELKMYAAPLPDRFLLSSDTPKFVTRSRTVFLSAGKPAAMSDTKIWIWVRMTKSQIAMVGSLLSCAG